MDESSGHGAIRRLTKAIRQFHQYPLGRYESRFKIPREFYCLGVIRISRAEQSEEIETVGKPVIHFFGVP
jgi:hypothetical protein